jgi:hypothetical protein
MILKEVAIEPKPIPIRIPLLAAIEGTFKTQVADSGIFE